MLRFAAKGRGGAEEDRTPDLRIANATLSQLSYGPIISSADKYMANYVSAIRTLSSFTLGQRALHPMFNPFAALATVCPIKLVSSAMNEFTDGPAIP